MGGDDQLPQHSSQSSTLPDDDSGCCDNQGGVCMRMHTLICAHTSKESGAKRGGKGWGQADPKRRKEVLRRPQGS